MQDEFVRLQSVLKKTIVFITHDFDEAIRLADRIAIMKDGEIVQQGTPEEIVLHPATDYVREFTRAVARAKVVRVGSLMKAGGGGPTDRSVSQRATIAEVAPMFLDGTETISVTGDDGAIVGQLSRGDVIPLMLGG
jgi:glycine betaine/proline transport system ATP-binding protein